jgi:hypothetical protein
MAFHLLLGIGAGLVSAFLFSAAGAGSLLGMLLMYLAPLPILIVALGWHHLLGILALCTGAIAVSFIFRSSASLAFAFGPGLSAWFPAYLTLLARPVAGGGVRWLSPGQLLFWLALTGAVVAFAAIAATTGGDLERYRQAIERAVGELLARPAGRGPAADPQLPAREIAAVMLWLSPAVLGAAFSLMMTVNLWLAGKAVALSGRLFRPWPELPTTRIPLVGAFCLIGGAVFSQAQGFAGFAAMALVGAFLIAFALQGLAIIHFSTRGRPARPLILTILYGLTVMLSYLLLPALALLGLVDTFFPLRRTGGPSVPPRT